MERSWMTGISLKVFSSVLVKMMLRVILMLKSILEDLGYQTVNCFDACRSSWDCWRGAWCVNYNEPLWPQNLFFTEYFSKINVLWNMLCIRNFRIKQERIKQERKVLELLLNIQARDAFQLNCQNWPTGKGWQRSCWERNHETVWTSLGNVCHEIKNYTAVMVCFMCQP